MIVEHLACQAELPTWDWATLLYWDREKETTAAAGGDAPGGANCSGGPSGASPAGDRIGPL